MQIKKLLLIIFISIGSQLHSQSFLKYRIEKYKGYYVWELKYEPGFGRYALIGTYFLKSNKKYSRLSRLYPGIDFCFGVDSILYRLIKESNGGSMNYYDFHRDTTMDAPVPDMLISGRFYKGVNGNLYMVNKTRGQAIFIDSVCNEFENMKVFSVVCNTPFKEPYVYFLDNRSTKILKRRDRKKLKLARNELKEIAFIECY